MNAAEQIARIAARQPPHGLPRPTGHDALEQKRPVPVEIEGYDIDVPKQTGDGVGQNLRGHPADCNRPLGRRPPGPGGPFWRSALLVLDGGMGTRSPASPPNPGTVTSRATSPLAAGPRRGIVAPRNRPSIVVALSAAFPHSSCRALRPVAHSRRARGARRSHRGGARCCTIDDGT